MLLSKKILTATAVQDFVLTTEDDLIFAPYCLHAAWSWASERIPFSIFSLVSTITLDTFCISKNSEIETVLGKIKITFLMRQQLS